MDLLLATRNPHKTREFAEILGRGFEISDLSGEASAPEVKETGRTFEENAILKALAVSQDRHVLVVADDSGLEVAALDGAPGIFSARYAGGDASDKANIDKLLSELVRAGAKAGQRRAKFRCVIAAAHHGKLLGTFEGAVEGMIIDSPRGSLGFGYDPIFLPDGLNQTFAELAAETKNAISHRARAVEKLARFLSRQLP